MSTYRLLNINNRPPKLVDTAFYGHIRFDADDALPDYVGCHKTLNARTANPNWKVYKFTYSASNVTRIQLAYGIWDDRITMFEDLYIPSSFNLEETMSSYRLLSINNRPPELVDTAFYGDVRFDPDDSQPDYIGCHITVNASTDDPGWKIYKFTYIGDNVTNIQLGYGAWDDRITVFEPVPVPEETEIGAILDSDDGFILDSDGGMILGE